MAQRLSQKILPRCVCALRPFRVLGGRGWKFSPRTSGLPRSRSGKSQTSPHLPCPHRQTGDHGYGHQRAFGGCDSKRQTRGHLGAPSRHTSEGHNPSGARSVSTFLSWSEASRTSCATHLCFLPSEGDVCVITPARWAQNRYIQGTGSQLVAARGWEEAGAGE